MLEMIRTWYLGMSEDAFIMLVLSVAVVGLACSLMGVGNWKRKKNG